MPEAIGPQDATRLFGTRALANAKSGIAPLSKEGGGFKDALLNSLDEVNRLQKEASLGVEKLYTGEANNVVEVLSAVRKADIAFSMLMETRNKLVEAYRELQQVRI